MGVGEVALLLPFLFLVTEQDTRKSASSCASLAASAWFPLAMAPSSRFSSRLMLSVLVWPKAGSSTLRLAVDRVMDQVFKVYYRAHGRIRSTQHIEALSVKGATKAT